MDFNSEHAIRIYSRDKGNKEWRADGYQGGVIQMELTYRDYSIYTGKLIRKGTEDFSAERYKSLGHYRVWVWDGEKMDKGGHRFFDCVQYAIIHPEDLKKLKAMAKNLYYILDGAIQVRKV